MKIEETREFLDGIFTHAPIQKNFFRLPSCQIGVGNSTSLSVAMLKKSQSNVVMSVCNVKAGATIISGPKKSDFESVSMMVLDLDRKNKNGLCASPQEIETLKAASADICTFLGGFNISPAYVVMSGNGIQMGIFFSPQPLSFLGTIKGILEGLNKKFEDACEVDTSLARENSQCRVPGFLNKKENLEETHAEGRVFRVATLESASWAETSPAALLALHDHLNPPQEIETKKAPLAKMPFYKEEFDSEKYLSALIRLNGIEVTGEITDNGHQYILRHCPFDERHKKTARLGVATDGTLFFKCFHASCQSYTWHDVKKVYQLPANQRSCKNCGVPIDWVEECGKWRPMGFDGSPHLCKNYTENRAGKQEKSGIFCQKILPFSPSELAEIKGSEQITFLSTPKKISLISAETGTGKSFSACKFAVDRAIKGELTTIATLTRTEADKLYSLVCTILLERGIASAELPLWCCKVVRNAISDDDFGDSSINKTPIIITVHAYLWRNGETEIPFGMAKTLFNGRLVIIDEIHAFFNRLFVNHSFVSLYRLVDKDTGTYKKTLKCPKTAKRGSCEGCSRSCHFYKDEKNGSVSFAHTAEINSAGYSEELQTLDKMGWESVFGTLFMLPVNTTPDYKTLLSVIQNASKNEAWSEPQYRESLENFAFRALWKAEYPVKGDNRVIPFEQGHQSSDDIKYPRQACGVPTLCTIDLFPILNLLCLAESCIMLSATIQDDCRTVIEEVARGIGWSFSFDRYESVSYQFDVTILATQEHLSTDDVSLLLNEIDSDVKKTAVFLATKSDVKQVASTTKGTPIHAKTLFWGEEEQFFTSTQNTNNHTTLVTHARGSLATGVDIFRGFDTLIVNACHFLPQAALFKVRPQMTVEEKKALLTNEVRQNITQILGRILRSDLQKKDGIVCDPRKIVILVYGLDSDLIDITISPRLCFSQARYEEKFFFSGDSARNKALQIANAISAIQNGRELENVYDKRIAEIAETKKSTLSKRQRVLSDGQRKENKTKERLDGLKERIAKLKLVGKPWKTVYRQLNLSRVHESERQVLQEYFNDLYSK